MDPKTLLISLQTALNSELELVTRGLETAKEARDSAPSAMESHSNTTRSEQEKMVTALSEKITALKNNLRIVAQLLKSPTPDISVHQKTIVVVPDGLGGRQVGDCLFVSQSAPIAKTL